MSTYTRLDHLKKTIASLQKNTIAQKSSLYVFSDAPRPGDENKVEKVREYLRTVNGFRSVTIVERKDNNRIKNNRGGIKQLLDDLGKIIFLEEDIVTAPGFLQFMNDALDFYENNDKVISICGYCPPIAIPDNYPHDTFILPRFSAWGFATWKNKFDPFRFSTVGFEEKKKDEKFVKKLSAGGEDIYKMVEDDCCGKINALDVRVMYHQAINNLYTVYPRQSLVQNIGLDGSGVHCGNSNKFHINFLWSKEKDFTYQVDPKVNRKILIENKNFRGIRKKENSFIDNLYRIACYAGYEKFKKVFLKK